VPYARLPENTANLFQVAFVPLPVGKPVCLWSITNQMVFGFFRKRKAQPTAPQQEAELAQAVEEAVQTEEVATQSASETAEQAAAQTPDDAIPAAESDSTDLVNKASAHETVSTEAPSSSRMVSEA